jgi:regulator of cell morphogenesis and NO signaling
MSAHTDTTDVIQPSSIVNLTLKQYPQTTSVFNQFGIDSCCGGATSISEAAARDGADPQALLDALNLAIADNPAR